mmetsp:Transcript_10448/g.23852  ORF Transcript_10448/g.23852 Transcript_10448/m.23852 type:complete len:224 (-) Transcript_10448:106-777(-)
MLASSTRSHLLSTLTCGSCRDIMALSASRLPLMNLAGSVTNVASTTNTLTILSRYPHSFSWSIILFITGMCVYSSICPGQSRIRYSSSSKLSRFSWSQSMFSSRYSMQYTRPPLGPSCSSSMTSSTDIRSRISNATSYLKCSAAGSRLTTWKRRRLRPRVRPCSCIVWQYVDLPEPAGPVTNWIAHRPILLASWASCLSYPPQSPQRACHSKKDQSQNMLAMR